MSESCSTCSFWKKPRSGDDLGRCRRRAPIPIQARDWPGIESVQPSSAPGDWCGEHDRAPDFTVPFGLAAPAGHTLVSTERLRAVLQHALDLDHCNDCAFPISCALCIRIAERPEGTSEPLIQAAIAICAALESP